MEISPGRKKTKSNLPIRLLVVTTICAGLVEAIIMLLLSVLPDLGLWMTVLADLLLIVVFIVPVLYLTLFRPLRQSLSEIEKSKELLRTSEEQFRAVSETAQDSIFIKDLSLKYTLVNPAMERLFERPASELIGLTNENLFGPEIGSRTKEADSRVLGGETITGEFTRSVGGVDRTLSIIKVPTYDSAGKINGLCGIARDITERKLAEMALQEKEARLEDAQKIARLGSWSWDLKSNEIQWSKVMYQLFGFDESTKPDTEAVRQLIIAEDLPVFDNAMEELLKGNVYEKIDYRFRRPDSEVRYLVTRAKAEYDDSGEMIRVVGTLQDITERKQTQLALEESENKLLEAQRVAHLGHYAFDIETGNWTSSVILDDIFGIDDSFQKNVANWLDIVHPDCRETMSQYLQGDVLTHHHDFDREYQINDVRTGERKWVHGLGRLSFDVDGNPVEMFGTVQDITERRLAEEALRASEEKYRSVFSTAANLITSVDSNGTLIDCNDRIEDVLGYKREEIIGQNMSKIIHPDYLPKAHETLANLISGGITLNTEYKMVRKNGQSIYVNMNSSAITDRHGDFVRTTCIIQDITERKQVEEALNESERKYRILFEQSADAILIIEDDKFVDCNLATIKMLGYKSKKDLLETHPSELSPKKQPDGRDSFEKANELMSTAVKQGTHRFEWDHKRQNGEVFPVEVLLTYIPLGERNFIHVVWRDITERKQAEEELRRYECIVSNSGDMMALLDTNFVYLAANETYLRRCNKTRAELIGAKVEQIFGKVFFEEMVRPNAQQCMQGQKVCYENWVDFPTGTKFMEITYEPYRGLDDKIIGFMVNGRDITERKQAEEKIRQFSAFPENNPAPLLRTDLDGRITSINPAAKVLLKGDLIGESIESYLSKTAELFSDLIPDRTSVQFEQKIDDNIFLFHLIRDESIGSVFLYGSDITETKRLQELESRAERLETAGTIAGQVAHDFNNLLAPLMAYPEFIREELPRNHPTLKYLDQIEKASQKIADINQDLLAMGRRGHYNREVLNLNTVVQNSLTELEPLAKTLACDVNLSEDLMDIFGGGAQLHRMICNLLHNAKDAMQEIGVITIKTENYYVDDVSVVYGRVPKGEYVKLTISDTGCGIPDEIVQKIFDPFFTSKTTDKRRGSGLGMSVVDSVIKDHNGFIDLSTKVGEGTSFYIYLPITRESIDNQELGETRGGNETILVVDDDDIQREVSTQLLKKLGYNISSVESGEKAIKFIRENPCDLIVLDMVMPGGIDGAETYRQIHEIKPSQKAILLSGFSESDRVFEAQDLGAGAFVRKPVTRKAIAMAVRTELDRNVESVSS